MTLKQLFMQTVLTFVAAGLGALLGAFLTRRTERFKHLQELRSTAYVDFLRGFAKVGRAQSDTMRDERSLLEELEGRVIVTDSRSRIAIYGSKDVVRSLANFIGFGTQSLTPEGMKAFAELCVLMRMEAVKQSVSFEDIKKVLFS
jgi:ATP-dependent protease HslVU (ClpYQ) peptidase subunit